MDISGVTLPENLTDDTFKREPRKKKRSDDMFEEVDEVRFCVSSCGVWFRFCYRATPLI